MIWVLLLTITGFRSISVTSSPLAISSLSQDFTSYDSCALAGTKFSEMNTNSTHSVKWICVKK